MRFEELAYAENGRPVMVEFHPRLTVVGGLDARERAAWVARLLGILEGVRSGDGASVVTVDRRGRRIRLERDDRGAARLTNLATGAELPYPAGHLSLDGRFDWFASVGLGSGPARDLILVESTPFGDGGWDEDDDAGGIDAELNAELNAELKAELEGLVGACRAAAERRDALVDRLDDHDGGDGEATRRMLVEEVEPAYVDALAALADACRPFGVIINAARLEAAGIHAAGIESVGLEAAAEVAAEMAARAEEANRARRLGIVAAAEKILVERAARARRTGRAGERFPLVVNNALAAFGDGDKRLLLDALARLGEKTQIVYLTDDPDTLAWASPMAAAGRIVLWQSGEALTPAATAGLRPT